MSQTIYTAGRAEIYAWGNRVSRFQLRLKMLWLLNQEAPAFRHGVRHEYQNYRDKNFDNIFPPAIEPLEALSIITDIVLDGELIVDPISNKQIWTLIICRLLTLHRNKWFKLGRRLNLF